MPAVTGACSQVSGSMGSMAVGCVRGEPANPRGVCGVETVVAAIASVSYQLALST